MIERWNELSDVFINAASSVIAIEYIHHGFAKKYAGAKRFLLFLFGWIFYFGVVTFLYGRSEFEGMTGIFYGLAVLLYAQIALIGKFREKVMVSMLWVLIALISTYMVYGIVGALTNNSLAVLFANHRDSRVYASIAAAIIKFSMGRIVLAVKQKKSKTGGQMEDWAMAGAFLMVFILTIGMFRLEEGQLDLQSRNYLSLFLLGGVCGIIFLLGYFYRKLGQQNEERLKVQYQLMNQEEQQKHIQYMQEMQQEIKQMKHDQVGKMEVLYRLVKNGRQEETLHYIEQMNQKLHAYQELPQDTGNEGLNAALLRAVQESREAGIQFSHIIQKISIQIDDMDMGILFQNLISNALEACKKVEGNREIELEIQEINGWLCCKLENTIKESVLKGNPKMQTNKADKKSHGFGMKSIHEIIKKYDGEYSISEKEGIFIQEIYLNVKNIG